MERKSKPRPASTASGGLGAVLFTPVQQRVLGLLFGQPDRRFRSGELIRLAASGTGAVHRLLTRLAESGLITVLRIGNQKYYQANRSGAVFKELHDLVVKTGVGVSLGAALAPLADRIRAAFVCGPSAKGDIDLIVVADKLCCSDLRSALQVAETRLGRTINPNLMTLAEWRCKRGQAGFVSRIIAGQRRTFVMGSDGDLAPTQLLVPVTP